MENETVVLQAIALYNKCELQELALKSFVLHSDRSETLLIGLILQNITWVYGFMVDVFLDNVLSIPLASDWLMH